jgi:Polysaccharide lyase 14/Disaggregatase related repeat
MVNAYTLTFLLFSVILEGTSYIHKETVMRIAPYIIVFFLLFTTCDDDNSTSNNTSNNVNNSSNNVNNQIEPIVGSLCGMWAEGTQEGDDGATRDYYNRGAQLPWRNYLGDWHDANGDPQGDVPFTQTTITDNNTEEYVQWDVTSLLQGWINETYTQKGFFLRRTGGGGTFNFRSKEFSEENKRPTLTIITVDGTHVLIPVADTYLPPSTYQGFGDEDKLTVTDEVPTLIRFDISSFDTNLIVQSATLTLYKFEDYGGSTMDVGIFRSSQGLELPPLEPIFGISSGYLFDEDIINHPDVLLFSSFDTPTWGDDWTSGSDDPHLLVVSEDIIGQFESFQNDALRVEVSANDNYGASLIFKFMEILGEEPEEIYFRYYIRFSQDWNPTDGGKLPGVSGTYGVAGWGGRPSDGTNGWSARGTYRVPVNAGNPYENHNSIGNYVYHADMEGTYGDVVYYTDDCRGLLDKNKWYSVEQYVRMNTPGENDGIIKAWIDGRPAYESTNWRFRDVDSLKIEQIWMNIYHGGTAVPPENIHLYIDNVVIAKSYIGPMSQ